MPELPSEERMAAIRKFDLTIDNMRYGYCEREYRVGLSELSPNRIRPNDPFFSQTPATQAYMAIYERDMTDREKAELDYNVRNNRVPRFKAIMDELEARER